jgi:hypothetical protein
MPPHDLSWQPAALLRRGCSVKIGRHPKNTIDLTSLAVSKRHCTLTLDASGTTCYITDRGSSHGTFLNGRRLGANAVSAVRTADTVTLGVVCPILLRLVPVLSTSAPPRAQPPSLEDLTSYSVLIATPAPELEQRRPPASPRPPPRLSASSAAAAAAAAAAARRKLRVRRAGDLFARLGDDLAQLILESCDLATLRAARAVERRMRGLSLDVQRGGSWPRVAENARALRLAMWVEGSYGVGGVAAHSAPVRSVQLGVGMQGAQLLLSGSADGAAKLWAWPVRCPLPAAPLPKAAAPSARRVVPAPLPPLAQQATGCALACVTVLPHPAAVLAIALQPYVQPGPGVQPGVAAPGRGASAARSWPLIATSCADGMLRLWQGRGGQVLVERRCCDAPPAPPAPPATCASLAWLAADAAGGQSGGEAGGQAGGQAGGAALLGGSSLGSLCLWRLGAAGACGGSGVSVGVGVSVRAVSAACSAHASRIEALATCGRLALSGGGDWVVRLWRLDGAAQAQPELVRSLLGHSGAVISVALGATGVAASCAADQTIRLWDVQLGTCTATLLPAGAPWCVALCDETETLLSAGNGPLIHMWSWKAGSAKPTARLAGHAASVCALVVDDGYIVSADTAGRLRVRRQPIQRRLT